MALHPLHSNVLHQGNVPKGCGPSNQSCMFCAQLGHGGSLGSARSAFMTRLGSARYMRGSIGFLKLVEHSLAVVEAREHTIQTCAKKTRTDGALIRYKRVGHRSVLSHVTKRHERLLRAAGDQMDCFICTDVVKSGKVSKMVNSSCGLAQKPARCLVASHADKNELSALSWQVISTALTID